MLILAQFMFFMLISWCARICAMDRPNWSKRDSRLFPCIILLMPCCILPWQGPLDSQIWTAHLGSHVAALAETKKFDSSRCLPCNKKYGPGAISLFARHTPAKILRRPYRKLPDTWLHQSARELRHVHLGFSWGSVKFWWVRRPGDNFCGNIQSTWNPSSFLQDYNVRTPWLS